MIEQRVTQFRSFWCLRVITVALHCVYVQAHVANNYIEKSKLELARAELEAQARMELNKKLEEVNKYLEEQAGARERLDHMHETNESDMRREFDRIKRDLKVTELLNHIRLRPSLLYA